jgi:ketosteroid isomerase-like protein
MNEMSSAQAEQDLKKLAEEWAAAELHGDTTFLQRTLADDFVGVGPLGFLLTKQEWLARHQTSDMQYTAHTLDEATVRVYHDAAIMIGRLTQEATFRGNPVNTQMRTTLVFVRQQGQWQLAGLHFSTIGQPPAFAQS